MNVQHFEHLFAVHPEWQKYIQPQLENVFLKPSHGHFPKWKASAESLSHLSTSEFDFSKSVLEIGNSIELSNELLDETEHFLKTLHPWRKGPFNFFGIYINSEWRCDMKWERIQAHIKDLSNKKVLDVGCGNGYYMLRMLGAGAKTVIGVDPTLIFVAQYYALTQCITPKVNAHLLPFSFEDLNEEVSDFDYVFSLGVLYHRRKPLEHLQRLFDFTKTGGTVFIETLVLDTKEITELIPKDRYAGMRNIWSVPSPNQVCEWLEICGYKDIQVHNIQITSIQEQRATSWMQNHSLANFLEDTNQNKTIEGHPAPTRAIISAHKPS
ncbi:MAG: tRNA 5-methoxyuridine(34)/uridine 5-oxyacetic acid(34) synthase CmoB [Pseudomonadota bacterium]